MSHHDIRAVVCGVQARARVLPVLWKGAVHASAITPRITSHPRAQATTDHLRFHHPQLVLIILQLPA